MKRTLSVLSVALFAGALAAPVMAQENQPEPRPAAVGQSERYANVRQFDGFLDSHPEVARQLSQNPSLIDNEKYLKRHPELREFLRQHPRAARAFKTHPYAFRNRERHYERVENYRRHRHHENGARTDNR